MDQSQRDQTARQLLADYKRELEELFKQRERLDRRAHHLTSAIAGLEGLLPPEPPPGPTLEGFKDARADGDAKQPPDQTRRNGADDRPLGIAAVRRVMSENPRRGWKAREIHAILEHRQWVSGEAKHPLRGTEAAINRLLHKGEIIKLSPGVYRLKSTELEPEASDGSPAVRETEASASQAMG